MSKRIKGTKIRINDVKDKNKIEKTKIRSAKIRKKTEKELEHDAIFEENISIFGVVIIVVLCLIVGITLGVLLYRLAMNSSNSAVIINKLLLK